MGVAIGSLIEDCKKKIELSDFKGKKFGFDAYNMLFQFVTTIRGIDGEPLKNENGEITSHYSGIFYRISNVLSFGIKPIFVYDGKSHELKAKTKQERRERRELAKEKLEKAIAEEDLENINKLSRQAATIDNKIIEESKELLNAMGVPCFTAPGEAEAQISFMTSIGQTDYSVSQDYDCFLFGSPNLIKNIGVSGKRKVPFKKVYVDVYPYILESERIFSKLNITREKLIWMSLLIGTDFNDKVEGVGPKTALKLVRENSSFEDIIIQLKEKNKEINFDYKEIMDIFLKPDIEKSPIYEKPIFDRQKIEHILIDKANFDEKRIKNYLNEFEKKRNEVDKQKTLNDWF
jgi:flap endonuclease-1